MEFELQTWQDSVVRYDNGQMLMTLPTLKKNTHNIELPYMQTILYFINLHADDDNKTREKCVNIIYEPCKYS